MLYRFHFLMVFCICLLAKSSVSQPDPLTYYLVLKDSSSYYCQIPYKAAGKWIVATLNGKDSTILYNRVLSVYVIDTKGQKLDVSTISRGRLNRLKDYVRERNEHGRWDSAFVVLNNGDTLRGRIQPARDYTLTFGIADVRTERYYFAEGFNELYIYGRSPEYSRYYTAWGQLYRVVEDGRCKLVCRSSDYYVSAAEEERDVYSIYYNRELTRVRTDKVNAGLLSFDWSTDAGFKANFRELFKDCPALVQEIESGTLKSRDLKQIVRQFNQCITK